MTKNETIDFMKKIKVHYQMFKNDEEYIVNEWSARLKDIDVETAYKLLDFHLDGNYSEEIPKLHYFTNRAKSEKSPVEIKYCKTICKHCGEMLSYEESTIHERRCLSIMYIIKNYKKYFRDKEINIKELYDLSEKEFRKKYADLLKIIFKKSKNEFEKKCIFYSFNGASSDYEPQSLIKEFTHS